MSIQISAVLCTHNRMSYLRKALQSLVDQSLSNDQYEIIVVDNGSTDNTKEVVNAFSDEPNLRYIYEPDLGLSKARNTGWQNAKGKYIAYLDDDAVADPAWLARYLDAFQMFTPIPGAIGGKCEPIWEAPRPEWLPDQMLDVLSLLDWSDEPIVLNKQQWLSGCNMAYPREILDKFGGFRKDLGRKGMILMGGEEDYLRRQLDSGGYASVYHPDILVGHHIAPARLTLEWWKKEAFFNGVSEAVMLKLDREPSLAGRVWLTVTKLAWAFPRFCLMFLSGSAGARFRRRCQIQMVLGFISGLWRPYSQD